MRLQERLRAIVVTQPQTEPACLSLAVANKATRCNARAALLFLRFPQEHSAGPSAPSPRYALALLVLITPTVVAAALLYPFQSGVTVRCFVGVVCIDRGKCAFAACR